MRTVASGDHGEAVLDIQSRLGALGHRIDPREHGVFGPSTERAVREFQQRRQLIVDGTVDDATWGELVEAGFSPGDRVLYLRRPFFRGDDVRALQTSLNLLGFDAGPEDGILGARTDRAIRDFQRNVGLPGDGIVGSTTTDALRRLRPQRVGPGRAEVREDEAVRRMAATLDGARIALDPGHGRDDPGEVGTAGTTESTIALAMAQSLFRELEARGANPLILRGETDDPSASERARRANEFGAEVLIAIHLNAHSDPTAEGCSTYYYGREGWSSPAGRRLADLIQEELTGGLGLKDGRAHPKALPILRETRMPAVQVEPCFITNSREEALACTEAFRSRVAQALADAAGRFFAGASDAEGRAEDSPPSPGSV